MTIKVAISDTVTQEQRRDPRFIKLMKNEERYYNSPAFIQNYRRLLALHESGHSVWAKKAGATNIHFYGPEMFWDSRPEYDCPLISRSSTGYTLPAAVTALHAIKAGIAGFVVREYYGSPNDAIAIGMDINGARQRYAELVGGTEADFQKEVVKAKAEIIAELASPAVQAEILAEINRFEQEIFPAPKLTSSVLRARRLAWAY
jgi:hypothetical protein